jgi:hypothetical protein
MIKTKIRTWFCGSVSCASIPMWVHPKPQCFLYSGPLWLAFQKKMHQTKNFYLGSFYYSCIMEVYSFRQTIYHPITHFWTKDMGQTMVLMGNVLGASLVHVAPPWIIWKLGEKIKRINDMWTSIKHA